MSEPEQPEVPESGPVGAVPADAWHDLYARSEKNRVRSRQAKGFAILGLVVIVGAAIGGGIYAWTQSAANRRFENLQRQLLCESVLNRDFERTVTRWANVPLVPDQLAERQAVIADFRALDRRQARSDCSKGQVIRPLTPSVASTTTTTAPPPTTVPPEAPAEPNPRPGGSTTRAAAGSVTTAGTGSPPAAAPTTTTTSPGNSGGVPPPCRLELPVLGCVARSASADASHNRAGEPQNK